MPEKIEVPIWIKCPVCHNESRTKVYKDIVLLDFLLLAYQTRVDIAKESVD